MMRIGSVICGLIMAFAVLGTSQANAQAKFDAPAPKIAIVDVQAILRASLAGKSVREQMDSVARSEQAELAEEEKRLRALDQELQSQRALLTPEVFAQRQQALQADVGRLQRRSRSFRLTLDQAFQRTMNEVQRFLLIEIRELSDELDLNLVLPRSQIVIAVDDFDITKAALERLDKRLPSIELKLQKTEATGNAN